MLPSVFTQKQKGREEVDAQKEAREGLGGRCAHGGDEEEGQEGETDWWRLSWPLTACFLHFFALNFHKLPLYASKTYLFPRVF